MGSGKTKLLAAVAIISLGTFALALYSYTQQLDRRIKQVERKKGAQPKVDLKPLEDKLKDVETNVSNLMPLQKLATEKTVESLVNQAVAGAAAKGGSGENVSKLLGEQVQRQMGEAMKKLKKEMAAQKGLGTEGEKLAKDIQAMKAQMAKLDTGGGPKAEQTIQRVVAAEKKINELAQKLTATAKSADASELKALAQETATRMGKLKADIAVLAAKVTAAEQMAKAPKGGEIIVQPGTLDTSKGNDIKQALRTAPGFRKKFDKIYSVDLTRGEIKVKPGYHVSYFVSPADLVIPKSSIWRYRRVLCQVDDKGIVKCTVLYSRTRGESGRASDEKGVVNFIMIACKVK